MVPDIEVIVLTEDVDFSDHCRGVSKPRVDRNPALCVELPRLAEVVHPVEVLGAGGKRGGNHLCKLALDFHPDRHRINENQRAGQACDEQLGPIAVLDRGSKQRWDLETTFVVDLG